MTSKPQPLTLIVLACLSLASLALGPAQAATLPEGPAAVPFGFNDAPLAGLVQPTALAFTPAPDPRLIATRQTGEAEVYDLNGALIAAAVDLSGEICSSSERGLLGVAVDPAFASNRYVYLFANFGGCSATNEGRVVRYTVDPNWIFDPASRVTIVDNIPSINGNHNGGDIHFGKDGKLYISVGDSGTGGALAADKSTLAGKILRVNADGTPASDNPFYAESGSQRCGDSDGDTGAGTCQEVYAYGLRNPFRIAMDPNATGTRFFINDVGQNTWEEINENVAGADYGWPTREGPCPIGQNCTPNLPSGNGFTDPIHWYGRSVGGTITGGAFVPDGIGWPGEFDEAYLFADYGSGKIFRLNRTSTTGTDQYTRVDFVTGLGGSSAVALVFGPSALGGQALYYTTYQDGGEIRRVVYPAAVLDETLWLPDIRR